MKTPQSMFNMSIHEP